MNQQPTWTDCVASNPQINPTWAANADLTYGDDVIVVLTPAGSTNVFIAEAGTGDLTGGSEPNWDVSAPNPGDTVSDNDYTWRNIGPQSSFPPTPTTWSPSTDYSAADTSLVLVWPTVPSGQLFAAYPGYFGNSDSFEPNFPCAVGRYMADGDGYWQGLGPTPAVSDMTDKVAVVGIYDYQFGGACWLAVRLSDGAPLLQVNKRVFGEDPNYVTNFHTNGQGTFCHPDGDVFYSVMYPQSPYADFMIQQFDRVLQPTAKNWTPPGVFGLEAISGDAAGNVYVFWNGPTTNDVHITRLDKDLTPIITYDFTRPADMGEPGDISADGTELYYLSNTNNFKAWNLAGGTSRIVSTTGPAVTYGGFARTRRSDGDIVYIVIAVPSISDYTQSGTLVTTVDKPGAFNDNACVDPDGDHCWAGGPSSPNEFMFQYDIATGAQTLQIPYIALDATYDPADLVILGPTATECCEPPNTGTDPILALNPERVDTFTYDQSLNNVATAPPNDPVTQLATTVAPSSTGNMWVVFDVGTTSIAIEFDIETGGFLRQVTIPFLVAELRGRHAFWQVSSCQFVTVKRDTHEVVRIEMKSDGEDFELLTGVLDTTYSLTIDPLDGWCNSDGTFMVYVEGNTLKLWDLTEDAFVRDIVTIAGGIAWPVWLSDDSIVAITNWTGGGPDPYLQSGDVIRFDLDGKTLTPSPYTYPSATVLAGGLYGLTVVIGATSACESASVDPTASNTDQTLGKIYLAGLVTSTQPGILGINLRTGELDEVVNTDVPSAFLSQASGFCAVGSASSSITPGSDGSSKDGNSTDDGLPPIPNVSCGPESTIRTPSPNAGCNQGGLGWVPTYTGPSGVVPSAPDPGTEEDLSGKRKVHFIARLKHTNYDTDTVEELRWAMTTLAKAGTGKIDGHLKMIGDFDGGLSDNQGNMQATTIDLRINDHNGRPIGQRWEQTFLRDEVTIEAISEEGRLSGATPVRIGTGLTYGNSYGTDLEASFTAVDRLFIEGGLFGTDTPIPYVKYPLTFYTGAPKDLATVNIPIILGEKSDEGAVNPVTGQQSPRGLCPARFVGMDAITGLSRAGRFNACLFAIYGIVGLYGSDLGGLGCYGQAALSNGAKPDSWITLDTPTSLSVVPTGGFANLILFTADGGRSEHRITGVNVAGNMVKVQGVIDPAVVDGTVSWYIARIDYLPRRVKIDIASRQGVDVMIPGYAGYTRATNYEDILCVEGSYRVTDFWIQGPLLAAHLNGECTIAFNAVGVEDQGDGTGLPFTDFFEAAAWAWNTLIIQRLFQPNVNYSGTLKWPQTGGAMPQSSDGWTLIKKSSFERCQAITAAALGGSGLQISAWIGNSLNARDFAQALNDNSGAKSWTDPYGRIEYWMPDTFADTTSWPRLPHVSHVFGKPTHRKANNEMANVIKGGCDFDADGGFYRQDGMKSSDAEAVRRNGRVEKPSKHYDGFLIANTGHFQWVLDQKNRYNKYPPVYINIPNCALGIISTMKVGSGIQFTSRVGPGSTSTGMVNRAAYILHHTVQFHSKTVTLVCWDVGISNANVIIPEASRFIITSNTSDAPQITDDTDIAPQIASAG